MVDREITILAPFLRPSSRNALPVGVNDRIGKTWGHQMTLTGLILLPLFVVYFGGILLGMVAAFVPALQPFAGRVQASYVIVLLGYVALAVCGVAIAIPAGLLLHFLGG